MSKTSYLQLDKPIRGYHGWAESMNDNADLIDSALGNLNSTIDDLPQTYRYEDTFNGPTGTVIMLPRAVDNVNEYSVYVAPVSRSATIGDVYVTKAVDQVTVHCSAANTADDFEITIHYIGSVSAYGGSIYRRYYVSPSTSITDHANAATDGSIAYMAALIGSAPAILVLPGNKTYNIDSDIDLSSKTGLILKFESGAVIDRVTGDETLTLPTPDNVDAGPGRQIFGDDVVVFANAGRVFADWWGLSGAQYAVNSIAATNGSLIQFGCREYTCNIVIPEGCHNLVLQGMVPVSHHAAEGGFYGTQLTAADTGFVVDTPATNIHNIVIKNIFFYGLGAGTAAGGIHLDNVSAGAIGHCSFENFADQAILLDDDCIACRITNNKAVNCLLNRTRAAKIGVMDIAGTDHHIYHNEATASLSTISSGNAYLCAWKFGAAASPGGVNFVHDNIGEISDIGFYVLGSWNRFSNCRADLNMGHGFEIASGAQENNFIGCLALRNSQDTSNTWDGFNVANFGNNFFVGCDSSSLVADAKLQRYGFYDATESSSAKNLFSGCYGLNNASGLFNGGANYGSAFPIDLGPRLFTVDDATPSVANGNMFIFDGYTGPIDITDFDEGTPGQRIYILDWSGNGYITIKHGSNIYTQTESDLLLRNQKIYCFVLINGVWRQVGYHSHYPITTAAGAGTDGTISSRSSNPLGECDGFAEIVLDDGSTVHVPYWADIAP